MKWVGIVSSWKRLCIITICIFIIYQLRTPILQEMDKRLGQITKKVLDDISGAVTDDVLRFEPKQGIQSENNVICKTSIIHTSIVIPSI